MFQGGKYAEEEDKPTWLPAGLELLLLFASASFLSPPSSFFSAALSPVSLLAPKLDLGVETWGT